MRLVARRRFDGFERLAQLLAEAVAEADAERPDLTGLDDGTALVSRSWDPDRRSAEQPRLKPSSSRLDHIVGVCATGGFLDTDTEVPWVRG